jgi:translocation and assembly module TamB
MNVNTGAEPVQDEEAAKPKEKGRRYAIQINAPNRIYVKSSGLASAADVDLEAGLSPNFTIDYDQGTRMSGEVRIIRGKLAALGRKFEIQKDARVAFNGPPSRPFVNVTAVHVNEREDVTVYLAVRGEGKDITLKTSSKPPLSETEIYTLLATGRRTLRRGAGATMGQGDAVSLLGSLVSSGLQRELQDKIPLDFSVESTGGEGIGAFKAEVGKYLSDQWYVGSDFRLGADTTRGESNVSIKTEYQITPHIGLQGEYGVDARTGSADLIWSRDY